MEAIKDKIKLIYCARCDMREYFFDKLISESKCHCGGIRRIVWIFMEV